MTKPKTPCYGCTERSVGCHGQCGRYKGYREKLDGFNDENRVYKTYKPPFKYKKNIKRLT